VDKKLLLAGIQDVSERKTMAKPRIQTRVDKSMKREVDTYADDSDMTQAEAVRFLVRRGLDHEQGVTADGGEVLDRVDELKEQQRKAEREDRVQNALLGGVVASGAFTVSGVASDLLSLLLTFTLALGLIGHSLLPVFRRVRSDE
jgi:antitoxin component of RelBE/YafQ-DinJ toxin-antitoxin module